MSNVKTKVISIAVAVIMLLTLAGVSISAVNATDTANDCQASFSTAAADNGFDVPASEQQ